MDLTNEEFSQMYLGNINFQDEYKNINESNISNKNERSINDLPDKINWARRGGTPNVKNQ